MQQATVKQTFTAVFFMSLFFLIIVLSLVKPKLLNSKCVPVCEQVHVKNKYAHFLSPQIWNVSKSWSFKT